MNLDRIKEKLSNIANDDAMLGRWMQKLKNNPQSVKAVATWASDKKDKKDNVKQFHNALNLVKKTAKFPHPQSKAPEQPQERALSRFERRRLMQVARESE